MRKHTPPIFLKVWLIGLVVSFQVSAGGFQTNMLSMKATSMGGTFTGIGLDASTAFYNPGAMTFLEYSQLSLGASFIMPSSSYLSPYAGNSDMDIKMYVPVHVYGVGKLGDKASVGISVNTPFHQWAVWPDDWTGRYIARESEIKALYIQPSFGYRFSETFGIGAGPVIGLGKTYLEKAIPVTSPQGETVMELDGRSLGFGFNIGLFYKPSEEFSMGLNYRSPVGMKIKDGDATFSNVPASLASEYPTSTSFETSYTLPSVITVGAGYKLTRDLLVCIDINYSTWNSFDRLDYTFKDDAHLDFSSGRYYDNAIAFRVGAQYSLGEKVDVRGGVAFDSSPVPDEYVSPENPDNDRFMFSVGGTLKFGEHVSADVAYMLQNIKEREVMNEQYAFGGNYKSLFNIFGVTLNYRF